MMNTTEDVEDKQSMISQIISFIEERYKHSISPETVEYTQETDEYIIDRWLQQITLFELNEVIKWRDEDTGETLLHIFTAYNLIKASRFLLENGAYVDEKSCNGSTPIHYAVGYALCELVNLLIEYKADLNAQDIQGDTPLHTILQYYCDESGFTKPVLSIIEVLIKYGGEVNLLNKEGKTSIDMVLDSKYDKSEGVIQTRKLLRKAESDIQQKESELEEKRFDTELMIDSFERLSISENSIATGSKKSLYEKYDCDQEKSSSLRKRRASNELLDHSASKLTRSTLEK